MWVELRLSYGTLNKHLKFPGTAYKLAIYFQLHAMTFVCFGFFFLSFKALTPC